MMRCCHGIGTREGVTAGQNKGEPGRLVDVRRKFLFSCCVLSSVDLCLSALKKCREI